MKAVVFTLNSLAKISSWGVDERWLETYNLLDRDSGLKRIEKEDVVYLIEINLETDLCPIIVLDQSVLESKPRICVNILERSNRVAQRFYTPNVSISSNWRQHYENGILSIFAGTQTTGGGSRIHFKTKMKRKSDQEYDDLFLYAITDGAIPFNRIPTRNEIYNVARDHFADAILTPYSDGISEHSSGTILLNRALLPQGFSPGTNYEEWYLHKLTEEQRQFVDKPLNGPVRLRGSAGTGKTSALVIKFLKDGQNKNLIRRNAKFGFVTHSHASTDYVKSIAETLDGKGVLGDNSCKMEIRTIYDLAHNYLRFELDRLTPLSLDGLEGKQLQFELIESVLKDFANTKGIWRQYQNINNENLVRWQRSHKGNPDAELVRAIMNEFANVLDADGIRSGEESGERYAEGRGMHRPNWLMNLKDKDDRILILEIHRRYRRMLSDMQTLSVDQMISDFNSFLDSNRWDRIRGREGYDAIFVDELHLFTAIERQTLHKLVKLKFEDDGRPVRPNIFMAYDLKQSPRDTFTQYSETKNNLFTKRTGLQNADLVRLSKVFRYTPEIAEFLQDLDAQFPAIDIPGEWEAYTGDAQLDNGNRPELTIYPDERSLFRNVFREAQRTAERSFARVKNRITTAVLCPSEEMFRRYLVAAEAQFKNSVLSIVSRDPISELRRAKRKFVFSMPEYVAGLQFQTVFLIHVDQNEAPMDAGIGIRRQFISNIYLGASRAEETLKLSACTSRGGASQVFSLAFDRNTLTKVIRT